jgi:hypothetical protein
MIRLPEGLSVSRHEDRTAGRGCRIVDETLIDPAGSFVEPTSQRVAGNDREPGPLIAIAPDQALGLGEQRGCDTSATLTAGDVNLLDLVLDDHHESSDSVINDRDRRIADAL